MRRVCKAPGCALLSEPPCGPSGGEAGRMHRCSLWGGHMAQLEGRPQGRGGEAPWRVDGTEVGDTAWTPSGFLRLTCRSAWPGVFHGPPCPWLWCLLTSNQAAALHLTSCEAGDLEGHQRAGVCLHGLCLFIAVELLRRALWLGRGGCPTKTAFRPHSAGNLGTKAG